MPIEWNFLNPYMRPLSENLIGGVNTGLNWRRHQQDLGERKRQFDAREPYRTAVVNKLTEDYNRMLAARKAAQQSYNQLTGGSGEMFDQPLTQDQSAKLLQNRFFTNFIGMQTKAPRHDLVRTGPETQEYFQEGTPGVIPFYKDKKDEWQLVTTTDKDGKRIQMWVKKGEGGPFAYYEKPDKGSGTDNYNQEKFKAVRAFLHGSATPEQVAVFNLDSDPYISGAIKMVANDLSSVNLTAEEQTAKVLNIAALFRNQAAKSVIQQTGEPAKERINRDYEVLRATKNPMTGQNYSHQEAVDKLKQQGYDVR